jgi:1-aminocyclopropane-1-carboxylate deaminase/D-cysteine desulfhydrase-like pyridoxal-dependent ACC family enzyme
MIELLREPSFLTAGIEVGILRLDQIHPIVSGNKVFKLKYFLNEAIERGKQKIVTVGGPYSNHLHASAFAARQRGIQSVALLKGKKPSILSSTLMDCLELGMELNWHDHFPDEPFQKEWVEQLFPDSLFIPQGGKASPGIRGAAEIMSITGVENFDTIFAACGTGTMGAGLLLGKKRHQSIQLISVLKNNYSVIDDVCKLLSIGELEINQCAVDFSHHMGGYAKKSPALFKSMNTFYTIHKIPTDFVYTGKLIHAFYDYVNRNAFKKNERILIIHSGGLQGNRSLTNGELIF